MTNEPCVISGGWLLISRLVLNSSTHPSRLPVKTSYREISSKQVFLTTTAMKELRKVMPFTQIRFLCKKKRPGRTFHITTAANSKGEAVVQYFSGATDAFPASCDSFVRMNNDNSKLARRCHKWGYEKGYYQVGKWGHDGLDRESRLYNLVAFEVSSYHWMNLGGSCECDDFSSSVSSGDFWKVFVR